jgi:Protein of unknown function (DUF2510)
VNAESGWYPDSNRIGMERYWDGRAWTEESRWPGTEPYSTAVPPNLPPPDGGPFESMFSGLPRESTVGFSLPRVPVARITSEPTYFAPRPSRRGLRATSLVLALVLVAGGTFLIFFGRHASADAAVAAAVNSSLSNRTADLTISGSGGAAGGQYTISGSGEIDFGQDALQLSLNLATGSRQTSEQAIYVNNVAYVNAGNEVGQILPGKSWVSVDAGQLTQGSAPSSLGAGSLGSNPAAVLGTLSKNGYTATDLGPSTFNNQSVEGYAVHVDAATTQTGSTAGNLSNPEGEYKLYINNAGLLAGLTANATESVSGLSTSEAFTLDFSDYGVPVNVTAPPASEVAPFQSFLQAAESSTTSD